MSLRAGSLFSGIGLFDLGIEAAGAELVFQCEIDAWCRKILRRQFPTLRIANRIFGDVRDVKEFPQCDLLFGGFPCQDLSVAGVRASDGIERARSGLWREFVRAVRQIRPAYVLMENVPRLAVAGLDRILCELAQIGYDAEWTTLSASNFGHWHRRERIFIVAYDPRQRRAPEIPIKKIEGEGIRGKTVRSPLEPILEAPPSCPLKKWPRKVAPLLPELVYVDKYKFEITTVKESAINPEFGEWMMGAPRGWTEGIPEKKRIEALGNAVVVEVAQFVGECVKKDARKYLDQNQRRA
jgi:DNA (cytosine-5)-methyltransferase 1